MIDVALLQSKTVLLVTSQKRLAGSQDDPASSIQREGVCNTHHRGKGFVTQITPFLGKGKNRRIKPNSQSVTAMSFSK